jgi:hypothetical protein
MPGQRNPNRDELVDEAYLLENGIDRLKTYIHSAISFGEIVKYIACIVVASLVSVNGVSGQEMAFQGKWKVVKEGSSTLDYFQYMSLRSNRAKSLL